VPSDRPSYLVLCISTSPFDVFRFSRFYATPCSLVAEEAASATISAQMNPVSSRATATAAMRLCLRDATRQNLSCNLYCAFQLRATVSAGCPC